MRVDGSMSQGLDRLAADPFWQHESSEATGLAELHLRVNRSLADLDLAGLGRLSEDELTVELRSRIARAHPDLSPEKVRRAADRARRALGERFISWTEGELRTRGAEMIHQTANRLRRIGSDRGACIRLLGELGRQEHGRVRRDALRALGLSEEAARGLDRSLSDPERLTRKLAAGKPVALHCRPPFELAELQQAMHQTASALDSLGHKLSHRAERDVDVFSLCPTLVDGMLLQMPERSFAVASIRNRLAFKGMCRKADDMLESAGSLLFEIGAAFAGPAGMALSITYNVGAACYTLHQGEQTWQQMRLTSLAQAASLEQAGAQALRAQGRGLLGLIAATTPGSAIVEEMAGAL
ncbi:MAG: hypothetical protein JXR96_26285 [Deltaproteobacteria bacterium]|nr:hypothetical protein [Deltaproteobacteria bacterium]